MKIIDTKKYYELHRDKKIAPMEDDSELIEQLMNQTKSMAKQIETLTQGQYDSASKNTINIAVKDIQDLKNLIYKQITELRNLIKTNEQKPPAKTNCSWRCVFTRNEDGSICENSIVLHPENLKEGK